MTPHNDLLTEVSGRDLVSAFTAVRGLSATASQGKGEYLHAHLDELGLDAADVVVIGDSEDDARAAHQVGSAAILVATGTTSRSRLDTTGATVTDTITDALALLGVPLR